MIHFFTRLTEPSEVQSNVVFVLQTEQTLSSTDVTKLEWLFGGAKLQNETVLSGFFVGPRAAMITPWSTNAVEITQNMAIEGIIRIEEFKAVEADYQDFDPMLSQKYQDLTQAIYTIDIKPEAILEINDIAAYNKQEGLSLS
ncbi:MAG: phosphoribosylformylglycinamidine synthase, partial [Bacteroidia bacterium]